MDGPAYMHTLRGPEIDSLRIFKVVVECGGFSQASRFLAIDLSTISRQIRNLEARLGFELCRRGRGGFALTQNGRIVHDVACRMVDALQDCDARLEGLREGLSGSLRIGLVNHLLSAPELRFPEIIWTMRRRAPDLIVDCTVLGPSEIMRQVENRHLHIGILGAADRSDQLDFKLIFEEEAALFCGPGHPLFDRPFGPPDEQTLRGMRYVGRTHNSHTDIIAHSLGMVPETTSNDIDVIVALILSGVYVGFAPIHAVDALEARGELRRVPLGRGSCRVPFYVCTRRLAQQARRTTLFLKVLRAMLGHG